MLPIAALAVIVSVAAFSAAGNFLAQGRPNSASTPDGDLEEDGCFQPLNHD